MYIFISKFPRGFGGKGGRKVCSALIWMAQTRALFACFSFHRAGHKASLFCETIQVVVLILLSACLRLGERGRWREQQRSCRRRIYFCPFPLFVSYTHTNTNSAFDGGKLTLLGGPPIAPVALALSHCTFRTFAFWILAWHHLAKISLSFPPFNVAVDAFNELVSVQFVV